LDQIAQAPVASSQNLPLEDDVVISESSHFAESPSQNQSSNITAQSPSLTAEPPSHSNQVAPSSQVSDVDLDLTVTHWLLVSLLQLHDLFQQKFSHFFCQ